MKQPQLNLRVPEDYHQIMRDIAQRFRESSAPSFALDLAAWMRDQPTPPPLPGPELAARVAEVEGQLLVLEARLAKLEAPPAAPTKRLSRTKTAAPAEPEPMILRIAPAPDAAVQEGDFIPEGVRSKASSLQKQGMTWEAVWKALGEPGTVDDLRIQTGQWRKRYRIKD